MPKKVTARSTTTAKKQAPKKAPRRELKTKFNKDDPTEVLRRINMLHGEAGPVIRKADEAWDVSDLRRPCGIPSLDLATGGGLVAGKVHQFDGPESTGKNYLLYRYFAHVQKHYGDDAVLAMACFESFVDKHFAQMCGCKIAMSPYDVEVTNRARALRGEPPLNKEEERAALDCPGVGHFHILEGPSERVLDAIISATESNVYQLIGIDSWDAMMTVQEDETPLGETPQVASPASLQTRWSKKVLDAFNPVFRCPECEHAPLEKKLVNSATMNYSWVCPQCKWKGLEPPAEVNETSIYCIRQVRAKINIGGGGRIMGRPYKSDGAMALQHLNHIRVSLHPGQAVRDGKVKIGKEVNWEISKAKAGAREGRTGGFTLYFDPLEVDTAGDLLAQCLVHGVIVDEGKGRFTTPEIEMDAVHGKDKVLQLLDQEPDLVRSLTEQLYVNSGLAHVRFR